ncbi:hypothetical protein [Tolypothrix sp. VBCCA 56010]
MGNGERKISYSLLPILSGEWGMGNGEWGMGNGEEERFSPSQ